MAAARKLPLDEEAAHGRVGRAARDFLQHRLGGEAHGFRVAQPVTTPPASLLWGSRARAFSTTGRPSRMAASAALAGVAATSPGATAMP
jgi:hypothetical protein